MPEVAEALSAEQEEAVVAFGNAVMAMQTAMEGLESAGVPARDALERLGILEQLPPAIRLML